MTDYWSDEQLEAAEARGRAMLETEPRALAARYDLSTGRIVVDLTNGCTFAFPARRVEELENASDKEITEVEIAGAGFGLHWPTRDADLSVRGLINGSLRHPQMDERARPPRRPRHLPRQGRGGAGERGEGGTAAEGGIAYPQVN